MTDNDIIIYLSNKKNIIWKYIPNNIKEYLANRFDDSESLLESYVRLKYNIFEHPKCPICGKLLKFNNHKNLPVYQKYCSYKCSAISEETKNLRDKTKEEKYGDKNFNNRNKYKQTCEEKYGNGIINVWQDEEIKNKCYNTKENKYGNKYYNNREKVIKTNKENLGVEFPFQSNNIINKCKETFINLYGVENPMYLEEIKEKIKQTNIKRYGCSCPLWNEEIHKKVINTCLERYGDEMPIKTKIIQEKLSNSLKDSKVQEKIINTKKKNKTIGNIISKNEMFLANKLKEIFPNLIQQYFCTRYPFACDIYIPEIDVFIEYNEYWTHGKHPFNKNNIEDIDKLNYWKSNEDKHPQYKSAIHTWTEMDVKKRNIAKENKLNYIEIWNIVEANELINSFKNEYTNNR